MSKRIVVYPNLVSEMAKRGETQKDIAKILGISIPTISRKFSGQIDWNITEVDILCEYFNKDYYQLFIKRKWNKKGT